MGRLILAIQFLTLLPVKREVRITRASLAGSMAWFPVVGAMQGALLVAIDHLLSGVLPSSITAGLVLLALSLTNGGLHLDGFVDTVDGLAGGRTAEERLRIMRDSSIGAIGTVFLVLLLLLKYFALRELPAASRAEILFLFPVMGRWAMVPMACWSEYARAGEEGLGAGFARNSYSTLAKATACAALLSVVLLGAPAVALMAGLGALAYVFSGFFKRRIGGVTGDVFGFTSEIAEASFMIMALAITGT